MSASAIRRTLRERDLLEDLEPLCRQHGASVDDLASPSRTKHRVAARRAVAVFLSNERGWSTTAIGELLGGRDHTTVLNLLGRLGARSATKEAA